MTSTLNPNAKVFVPETKRMEYYIEEYNEKENGVMNSRWFKELEDNLEQYFYKKMTQSRLNPNAKVFVPESKKLVNRNRTRKRKNWKKKL